MSASIKMNLQEQARQFLTEGKYSEATSLYEEAVANEPDVVSHYWYLGLAYLLQNHEEAAQATWMLAMAEVTPKEIEECTGKLIDILETEAERQVAIDNPKTSWLIRQHIREINPAFINNLLHLIKLSINLGEFTPEQLHDWEAATVLNQIYPEEVNSELLLQVLKKLLEFPTPETLAFAEACLPHLSHNPEAFVVEVLPTAVKLANQAQRPDFAANLAELCLKLKPEHPEVLKHLSMFYSRAGCHQQAIETATLFFNNCENSLWKVQGSYLVQRAFLRAGAWSENLETIIQHHKSLVRDLMQNLSKTIVEPSVASSLIPANYYLPYVQDQPQELRWLQNQIAELFQNSLQAANSSFVEISYKNSREKSKSLKVGYIAHTLKAHSVGWLSRWLFQYYDRELFQTNLYLIYQEPNDHQWFREQVDCVYNFGAEPLEIATQIKEDQIDILVDLDSLTLDTTCQVMALKPAPVQITWLGWDASGIPAIDYYIADSYVLPENAQDYYSEKIWRLPQTYIAIDGFEVGVPTLRCDQLEIPSDATIYFSAQQGFKRHPNTVHLQMQIIKQVANSYFLIKGLADETTIQKFFTQIAEEEGVDPSRLRFLPRDLNEFVHRANLAIADVVLDTYPYNGATTTLETLWMSIPLVTRVGEQFAARNSYGFMMNAGVTEGIAWTDEEYVEWGVRLGKDPALRQQVAWKLRQSRQTSPLWNAKQFTREMEKAYQQMWQRYVEAS